MELGRKIAQALEAATFERVAGVGLANAEANRSRIARSVLELAETPLGSGDAAIVVGAGPSLYRRRSLERLRASRFAGTIVAADGALGACLRAGVAPHVVVSVDPHPERIVLITNTDPTHLRAAWEAGVNSVLTEHDPMNTVVLAVLACCLRTGSTRQKPAANPGRQ